MELKGIKNGMQRREGVLRALSFLAWRFVFCLREGQPGWGRGGERQQRQAVRDTAGGRSVREVLLCCLCFLQPARPASQSASQLPPSLYPPPPYSSPLLLLPSHQEDFPVALKKKKISSFFFFLLLFFIPHTL